MYCPVCLNDTLFMHQKGTVFIKINKQTMSTSHFLYNLLKEEEDEVFDNLSKKLDEVLKEMTELIAKYDTNFVFR